MKTVTKATFNRLCKKYREVFVLGELFLRGKIPPSEYDEVRDYLTKYIFSATYAINGAIMSIDLTISNEDGTYCNIISSPSNTWVCHLDSEFQVHHDKFHAMSRRGMDGSKIAYVNSQDGYYHGFCLWNGPEVEYYHYGHKLPRNNYAELVSAYNENIELFVLQMEMAGLPSSDFDRYEAWSSASSSVKSTVEYRKSFTKAP